MQKKAENNISKKDAKKAEMQKKRCKKSRGCMNHTLYDTPGVSLFNAMPF